MDLAQVAKMASRTMVHDMGNSGGKGPRLFVEGSQYMNAKRSDNCMAWWVMPLPKPKAKAKSGKRKKATESDDEEDGGKRTTHKVEYEDLEIVLSSGEKLAYRLPMLVAVCDDDFAKCLKAPLHRVATALDAEEFEKVE